MQSTSCYVLKQAYYQADLLSQRRGIRDVIEDTTMTEQTREKLSFVLKLLDYAKTNDLNVGGSYSHYIELKKKVITYLVYAAPKDSLELKTWWFPIVGSVPYLGFFNAYDRDQKAEDLVAQGYDVNTSGSIGMSFLGWIVDPLYSTMIERSFPELADVIFHELAHKTYWYANDPVFNENLAEFVGVYLTKKYFENVLTSKDLESYEAHKRDRQIYKKWLVKMQERLKSLYDQKNKHELQVLLRQKQKIIADAQGEFKSLTLETNDYAFASSKKWNNASIGSASLYLPKTDIFLQAFKCSKAKTVGKFLKSLQKRVKRLKKGKIAIASYCLQ